MQNHIFIICPEVWIFIALQNVIDAIIPAPGSRDHRLAHLVLIDFPAFRDNYRHFVATCCVWMFRAECIYISLLCRQYSIITINFDCIHILHLSPEPAGMNFFCSPFWVISLSVIIIYTFCGVLSILILHFLKCFLNFPFLLLTCRYI